MDTVTKMRFLERDVVVGDFRGLGVVVGCRGGALVEACRGGAGGTAVAAAGAFFAAREKGEFVDDDLGAILLLARLLVVPTAGLDLSLDVEFGAFLHVVANDLRGAGEGDQVVPFGAVLPIALGVFLTVAGGHGEIRDDGAAGGGADLGVLAHIS